MDRCYVAVQKNLKRTDRLSIITSCRLRRIGKIGIDLMKLDKVRIREFQSIHDSTEFEIGDITCLVGKNEAGKTAILKALYRLNPIIEADEEFSIIDDYPRRFMGNYEAEVKSEKRKHAQVVQATFILEIDDIESVEKIFGSKCFKDEKPSIILHKGYSNECTFSNLNMNSEEALTHLVKTADLPQSLEKELHEQKTAEEMGVILVNGEQNETVEKLLSTLRNISKCGISDFIYDSILRNRIPKFLYFDEYYQMKGQDNLDALKSRIENDSLEESDYPLLGLIDLAGLDLDQLTDPKRTEVLISRLEGAENQLTGKVLQYWSQNQHLGMKFDIRPAQPEDPPNMRSGVNIWGRVLDTKHKVSTALGTRSRGFIWFFSFLAWYSKLREEDKNIILLLDEPGLSLHAKAQEDLLRYFEEELKPHHQVLYTTHSPFMVDPRRFDRTRIVQDLSIESNSEDLPEQLQGTRVTTEILDATPDSLFPLQAALGYEIYQTLFIGPNSLIVEGVSDLLYIQTMSTLLQGRGHAGLSAEWIVTPVGGSDKIPTFVSLIGAQRQMNVAVLMDIQNKDQQKVENLYKKKLLKKNKIITYADYVEDDEADIEDMFDEWFYIQLVNRAYGSSISLSDSRRSYPRILRRIDEHLNEHRLPDNASFNHYLPARYLSDNIASLEKEICEDTLCRFQKLFDSLNALISKRS